MDKFDKFRIEADTLILKKIAKKTFVFVNEITLKDRALDCSVYTECRESFENELIKISKQNPHYHIFYLYNRSKHNYKDEIVVEVENGVVTLLSHIVPKKSRRKAY